MPDNDNGDADTGTDTDTDVLDTGILILDTGY
jgi:hypothetical protein